MLFANVCAGCVCCCYEVVGHGAFWAFWVLLGVLYTWEVLALLVYPSCVQDSGYEGVRIAGHALSAEVGGGAVSARPSGSSLVCTKVCLMYSG